MDPNGAQSIFSSDLAPSLQLRQPSGVRAPPPRLPTRRCRLARWRRRRRRARCRWRSRQLRRARACTAWRPGTSRRPPLRAHLSMFQTLTKWQVSRRRAPGLRSGNRGWADRLTRELRAEQSTVLSGRTSYLVPRLFRSHKSACRRSPSPRHGTPLLGAGSVDDLVINQHVQIVINNKRWMWRR